MIVTKQKSEIANVSLFTFFTSEHYKIGPLHAVIQMWTCLGISILSLSPDLVDQTIVEQQISVGLVIKLKVQLFPDAWITCSAG